MEQPQQQFNIEISEEEIEIAAAHKENWIQVFDNTIQDEAHAYHVKEDEHFKYVWVNCEKQIIPFSKLTNKSVDNKYSLPIN